jgi:hypothetical protein
VNQLPGGMEKFNEFLKNRHEASSLEVQVQSAGTVPCIAGRIDLKPIATDEQQHLSFQSNPGQSAVVPFVGVPSYRYWVFGGFCARSRYGHGTRAAPVLFADYLRGLSSVSWCWD